MKSSEPKDTSIDSSEKKSSQNKPVLFTIESPNKKFLKKKRFKVRTKKEEGDKETSNICLRYGYWSKSDHTKFIEALYLYENDWTRIQEYVNDRTDKQVHSHAQKFFLKLKTFIFAALSSLRRSHPLIIFPFFLPPFRELHFEPDISSLRDLHHDIRREGIPCLF